MKEIRVHTPFTLTMVDGQMRKFDAGRHCVEDDVADHWFVQAHAEQTDTTSSAGDLQTLEAALREKQERIDALTSQVEELESQLAALLSGSAEEEDTRAEKSKSSRHK